MIELLAAGIFAAGYTAIALEHRFFISKAATSLSLAVALWIVASLLLPTAKVAHFLEEASVDIFGIVIFLLTAMTLVEILVHYHFFDLIENWLRRNHWGAYRMGWMIVVITFFLSAFLDNLTTCIVMIQIGRRLFRPKDLMPMAALIVITANAGGAFSPIGDVTTIMLWFAEKFSALEVITQGFLPAAALAATSAALMLRYIRQSKLQPAEQEKVVRLSRSDRIIVGVTMASFLLPLAASTLHLPPYMGLLAGLGIVWFLIDMAKQIRPQPTHLDANIKEFLQRTDIESIQFFLGILLAVSALHALGVLDIFTHFLLGSSPTLVRIITAFVGLGLGSAVIDNVPLTAAAISSLPEISASFWVLLAIMVGTGGSLLVIGSAAGVVAMGMVPELTFGRYIKIATWPALWGFVIGIAVWVGESFLFLR